MLNVLQRLLGGNAPPNRVQEIKNDTLKSLQVIHRDDAMLLYAPSVNQEDRSPCYEIVLQRLCTDAATTSFSLYRADSQEEAEKKFNAFMHRLPIFIAIVKEYYNINGLQKVCDALSENPSWSLAHLVAFFNLVDYVNHPKILEFIDYPDHQNYMSPFQLAIKSGNMEVVKTMLPLSKMEHLDNNSNSVYHYAAITTKEIINVLTAKSIVNINHFNSDGFTPLHLACLSDKPECVKALLLAGADVNLTATNISKIYKSATPSSVAEFLKNNTNKLYTQDMKYGGTPLHWCSSRETLQALIERGCDVNAQNFDGRTALHVMVARNRLECVVTLLSHDAEVDLVDKDGNTPLHIAVEKKFVPIVQSLIVFGSDINMKNKEGKTPRHMVGRDATGGKEDEILYILHSVGAERCPEDSTRCPPGCNAKGTYNGIPPVAPESMEQREHIQDVLALTTSRLSHNFGNSSKNGSSSEFALSTHLVDTTAEQKGHSVMDAILGMFTSKPVKAETPKKESPTSSSGSAGDNEASRTAGGQDKPYGRGRLLCLDGGGIRGLVLVQMLLEIEKLAQTPIIHLFDWVAGTSTGGILALGLGCGKTMRQCMGKYSSEALED